MTKLPVGGVKDVYVVRYTATRWAWRYYSGENQKLLKSEEEAIAYGKDAARRHGSDLWVEWKDGSFKKVKVS